MKPVLGLHHGRTTGRAHSLQATRSARSRHVFSAGDPFPPLGGKGR